MDLPLSNTSSTGQNDCGAMSNRLPRRRVQADANLMLHVGEMDDTGRQEDVPRREAPPPEATTAPLVNVITVMRAARPA